MSVLAQTVLGMSKTVRIHVFTTLWPVGNVKSFQMLCDELELRRCFDQNVWLLWQQNYVDVLGKLSSQLIITWLEKRWKQRHPYDDSGVFSQTTSKETKIRNISGVLATLVTREIAVVLISAPVFLLIPSHFGTVSHKEECGAVNLPPVLLANPSHFGQQVINRNAGSKGPFLCFLLIPSHFGKISHQGDCGGANIRSGIFAYPITFWDS
ncbi:Tartrate-resistant acid phosphatase type [Trichinella pseudospiralis]